MDIAIVTGANTRTGLAISRKLIEIGCRVYGLGKNFVGFPLENTDFVPVTCDLSNTAHLCQVVQEILDKEKDLYVLVNHARCSTLAPHEKQELNDLEELVQTNLLTPLILTRLALPSLIRLKGYVINICVPKLPEGTKPGSAFLATEEALRTFSDQLLGEVRRDKVKVCTLALDTLGAKALFEKGFNERDNDDLILASESIAQAVEFILSQKKESVISRLDVRPQKGEPDDEDRQALRKVSPPASYVSKKTDSKIVIGRLQKAAVPETKDQAPATYMNTAREVAEAEAKDPSLLSGRANTQSSDDSEGGLQANRKRRRRRNRRRGPKDPQSSENPAAKAAEQVVNEKESEKVTEVVKPIRPRNRNNRRRKSDSSTKPAADLKQDIETAETPKPEVKVVKKVAAKKVAKKRASAKKVVSENPQAKTDAPKKVTKKRAAKKAVKKTAKKKVVSKTKDS